MIEVIKLEEHMDEELEEGLMAILNTKNLFI
jgi:hypothetical protein